MKYTVEDFSTARFAEHPRNGALAYRMKDSTLWDLSNGSTNFNHEMVEAGWTPIVEKSTPTLTDSEVGKRAEHESDDWLTGYITGFQDAGGEILDDPVPTNTERIAAIITEKFQLEYRGDPNDAIGIAKYLNDCGVIAPEEGVK